MHNVHQDCRRPCPAAGCCTGQVPGWRGGEEPSAGKGHGPSKHACFRIMVHINFQGAGAPIGAPKGCWLALLALKKFKSQTIACSVELCWQDTFQLGVCLERVNCSDCPPKRCQAWSLYASFEVGTVCSLSVHSYIINLNLTSEATCEATIGFDTICYEAHLSLLSMDREESGVKLVEAR